LRARRQSSGALLSNLPELTATLLPIFQQVCGCLDQSLPMLEHPIAVAPDEFELMLTALASLSCIKLNRLRMN
jgi:hypothetical protein